MLLDATGLDAFDTRFPNIAAVLASAGLDPSSDLLPVHPAAHHLCGGVLTDLDGASTVPGLWACGEVACTGVHGANRLASNSLLEGMVFAPRAVEAILGDQQGPQPSGAMAALVGAAGRDRVGTISTGPTSPIPGRFIDLVPLPSAPPIPGEHDVSSVRARLQRAMTTGAGVQRSADSLRTVLGEVAVAARVLAETDRSTVGTAELANLVQLSHALVSSALQREESRGTHWRDDFPDTSADFRIRILHGSADTNI